MTRVLFRYEERVRAITDVIRVRRTRDEQRFSLAKPVRANPLATFLFSDQSLEFAPRSLTLSFSRTSEAGALKRLANLHLRKLSDPCRVYIFLSTVLPVNRSLVKSALLLINLFSTKKASLLKHINKSMNDAESSKNSFARELCTHRLRSSPPSAPSPFLSLSRSLFSSNSWQRSDERFLLTFASFYTLANARVRSVSCFFNWTEHSDLLAPEFFSLASNLQNIRKKLDRDLRRLSPTASIYDLRVKGSRSSRSKARKRSKIDNRKLTRRFNLARWPSRIIPEH